MDRQSTLTIRPRLLSKGQSINMLMYKEISRLVAFLVDIMVTKYVNSPFFCSFLFFLNGPTPASFSFIFGLFKQTLQSLQQIYVNNVHPVYGARIRTHDLWNMSLFP